ncbi:hypothetical protein [Peribacillus simplex]|uniref:hypothetical protein n=1 Tax=Peribacillus simplex TaxID=1478 RepID=UPI002853045E|nr:hypothetical protein [Peribacillus simplex]MDR4927864.1 hypothetical protein [Peribacillus simplex]
MKNSFEFHSFSFKVIPVLQVVGGEYQLELFSFLYSLNCPSYPEAIGPRHLDFEVDDINQAIENLEKKTFLVSPSVLMS